MRNQYLEMLHEMEERIDSKTSLSNFIVLERLVHHPDIQFPDPILLFSSMEIDVNENFINDTEIFEETCRIYIKILNKIWDGIFAMSASLENRKIAFLNVGKRMSLKYSI